MFFTLTEMKKRGCLKAEKKSEEIEGKFCWKYGLKRQVGKKSNFYRPWQIQNPYAFHPREKTRRECLRAIAILVFHTG